MKPLLQAAAFLLLLLTLTAQLSNARAQGTAFTYQGRINNGGNPASGLYDFQFALSNAPSGGSQIGGIVTSLGVSVTNGLFTTSVDFGTVFTGQPAWLAIGVRTNGGSTYAGLTPLQPLTPAPYSVFANTASNLSGGLPAAQINGTVPSVNFSGTYGNTLTLSNAGNSFNGTFFGNGGGLSNITVIGSQVISIGNTNSEFGGNFFVGSAGNGTMSGAQNTAAGSGALSANVSGDGNTALGYTALQLNTDGTLNTAIGNEALQANTNGIYNTAVGFAANGNSGTGSFNTSVGMYALGLNTTGSNNIALGYAAGYNNDAGSNNIDIGNQGLASDTNIIRIGDVQTSTFIAGVINGNGGGLTNLSVNGSQVTSIGNINSILGNNFFVGSAGNATMTGGANTAVGGIAFSANVSGEDNTALGSVALISNISGSDNTAVGNQALEENTSGVGNTAVGSGANFGSDIGSFNTSVGMLALGFSTTGSNNTALGYLAGLNILGSYNIDIGNQGLASDTNIIRIGDVQTSTFIAGVINGNGGGLTNLSAASLTGGTLVDTNLSANVALLNRSVQHFTGGTNTFSGNVGIGTATPTTTLSVYGNIFFGTERNNNVFSQVGDTLYIGAEQKYLGNTLKTAIGGSTDWINLMANPLSSGIIFGTSGFSVSDPHTGASAVMVVKPNGRVGIGTATPGNVLDVALSAGQVTSGTTSVDSSLAIFVRNTNTTGTLSAPNVAGIGFGQTSTRQAIVSGTFGDDYLDFFIGGNLTTPRMRINHSGNVGIGTINPTNALDVVGNIDATGKVFANGVLLTSDRNAKENFSSVSPAQVLEKVAAMPIATWNYKTESKAELHIGPMAQDFHAAFGLNGGDDRHISVVDENGVALAAIQGLNEKLEEEKAENAELKLRLAKLEQLVAKLSANGE